MGWADQIKGLEKWATWVDTGVEKNHGTTVVLYRQGKDIRTKCGGSLVEEGWCFAMSVYWIIKTARGESFWDWFHPPVQACPNLKDKNQGAGCGEMFVALREMMRGEDQKAKAAKLLGDSVTIEDVKKISGWWIPKVTHDSPCLRDYAGDGHALWAMQGDAVSDLLLTTRGYKLLATSGSDGAHAMAARIVGGTVVFMDPNYGELFFPSFADFRRFMNGFWKNTYGPKTASVVLVTSFTDPEVIKYG